MKVLIATHPCSIDREPFARGGEGTLHAVRHPDDSRVVKLYRAPSDDIRRQRADFLIANPPADVGSLERVGWELVWPEHAVTRPDGTFLGVSLRRVRNAVPLSELTAHATVLDRRMGPAWSAYRLPSRAARVLRLQLAERIARIVCALHDDGRYVLGDLKPDNLLVTYEGQVALVDCDSVQVTEDDALRFRAPVRTDDYIPPEGFDPAFDARCEQGEPLAPSWDEFALAVIVYQLLLGIHPFAVQGYDTTRNIAVQTVRDAIRAGFYAHAASCGANARIPLRHRDVERLPATIRDALHRSLEQGHRVPSARLSAREWVELLAPRVPAAWRLTASRRMAAGSARIRSRARLARDRAYGLAIVVDVRWSALRAFVAARRWDGWTPTWRDTVCVWLGIAAWSTLDVLLFEPRPSLVGALPAARITPLGAGAGSLGPAAGDGSLLALLADPLVNRDDGSVAFTPPPSSVLTFARFDRLIRRDSVLARSSAGILIARQHFAALEGRYEDERAIVRYEHANDGLLQITASDTLLLLAKGARLGDQWWSLHGTPRLVTAVRSGMVETMGAIATGVELRIREPRAEGDRVRVVWLSARYGVIREGLGDDTDAARVHSAVELVGARVAQMAASNDASGMPR